MHFAFSFFVFPICFFFLFARNQQSYDLLRTYVVCIANMYLFGLVLKHIDIHVCMYISIAIHMHKTLLRLLYYSHTCFHWATEHPNNTNYNKYKWLS